MDVNTILKSGLVEELEGALAGGVQNAVGVEGGTSCARIRCFLILYHQNISCTHYLDTLGDFKKGSNACQHAFKILKSSVSNWLVCSNNSHLVRIFIHPAMHE